MRHAALPARARPSADDATRCERYALTLFVGVTPISLMLSDGATGTIDAILAINAVAALGAWGALRIWQRLTR